jgi:rfaE bifunctional protein kinase chain/domain
MKKILALQDLILKTAECKKNGGKVVLCHGHFNVIHPGHLRFINFCRSLGDLVIVSVVHESTISNADQIFYFSQQDRAEGLASLEQIDYVHKLQFSVEEFILTVKPDIYVKGREFETNKELIAGELKAMETIKGELIFSSGEVEYSSLLPKFSQDTQLATKIRFIKLCQKHDIDFNHLKKVLPEFTKRKILVIGDSIIDEFIACDTLGVSSEAPVLAIRELNSSRYVGGAAIVAQHLASMGATVSFVSVVGKDQPAKFLEEELTKSRINHFLFEDENRPTTFKIRYMVENQKILRVSRLKQEEINFGLETLILHRVEELIPSVEAVIFSDFVYGVITENLLKKVVSLCNPRKIKIFGDLQCSSQFGDVSKFKNFELITPTEKEARIALNDYSNGLEKLAINLIKKTKNKHQVITLGSQGLLAFSHDDNLKSTSEYFPALETKPLDVAGAGDSLLSTYALSLTSGLNLFEASALGSVVASIAVNRVGNIPITPHEMIKALNEFIDLSSRA